MKEVVCKDPLPKTPEAATLKRRLATGKSMKLTTEGLVDNQSVIWIHPKLCSGINMEMYICSFISMSDQSLFSLFFHMIE